MFTQKFNRILSLKELSLKSKGLYVFLCNLNQNVDISIEFISSYNSNSTYSIRTSIKELVKFGFLEIEKLRQKGQFLKSLYKLKLPNNKYKSIFKRDDVDEIFTSEYKEILQNQNLSLKDKGMYIFLCELDGNVDVSIDFFSINNSEGDSSIRSSVKSLKTHNLLILKKKKIGSQFNGMLWVVSKPNGNLKEINPINEYIGEPGYVYILDSKIGVYKIGLSKRPKIRLNTLGVTLPFDLELKFLLKCEDMNSVEQQIHDLFDTKRQKGEWFKLNNKDLRLIKEKYNQLIIKDFFS